MYNITSYNKRIRKVFLLSQYSHNKVPKGTYFKAIAEVFTEREGGGERKGRKQKEKEKEAISWEKEKLMFENQSK